MSKKKAISILRKKKLRINIIIEMDGSINTEFSLQKKNNEKSESWNFYFLNTDSNIFFNPVFFCLSIILHAIT